ncbi:hypothetical protein M595_2664 [Lyngbya aestuarii BL J]|uniref:Uncharacterized protein n=1 Tax=Lyngbya aestuarii BL J TaxID=1348334 RepID=U7QHI2_9CYAN|nr:hypothetical protein M595_2664 [Lyngbya aestuarii BL J]
MIYPSDFVEESYKYEELKKILFLQKRDVTDNISTKILNIMF